MAVFSPSTRLHRLPSTSAQPLPAPQPGATPPVSPVPPGEQQRDARRPHGAGDDEAGQPPVGRTGGRVGVVPPRVVRIFAEQAFHAARLRGVGREGEREKGNPLSAGQPAAEASGAESADRGRRGVDFGYGPRRFAEAAPLSPNIAA